MSAFYGLIEGNRGAATRCGSRNSGYRAAAQSYDGSVITSLRYDRNDNLEIRIDLSDDSTAFGGDTYFRGSLEELKEAFNMYKAAKAKRERTTGYTF